MPVEREQPLSSSVVWGVSAAVVVLVGLVRGAEPAPAQPLRYDVSINGENFTVEAGQVTRVESTAHPGKKYQLAVQVAQIQHWKLNNVQFDYQLGSQVTDNHKLKGRTATLKHPLGFVAVLTDLGGALPADAKSTAAAAARRTGMKKTLSESGIEDVKAQQAASGSANWGPTPSRRSRSVISTRTATGGCRPSI